MFALSTGSKTYYIPKNIKSNWDACRRTCKDSKLDFAHFDSKAEADYVFGVFVSYNGTVNMTAFVDGVTTVPGQKTGWYWIKPNTLIDYISGMTWTLYEPDNFANDQYCLGIQKLNSTVGWTDANCYGNANATAVGPQSCICQG